MTLIPLIPSRARAAIVVGDGALTLLLSLQERVRYLPCRAEGRELAWLQNRSLHLANVVTHTLAPGVRLLGGDYGGLLVRSVAGTLMQGSF